MGVIINPYALASAGGGGGCGTPSVSSGLKLWLDASSFGLNDGDQITTWQDCSGNGNDATGVVVATKPIYKATAGPNSKPCVLLVDDTGTPIGGYFTLPNFLGSLTAAHGFAVVKKISSNDNSAPPFGDFGSDLSGDLYAFSDARIFSAFGSNTRYNLGTTWTGSHTITNWLLLEFRAESGAWSARMDGDQIFSNGSNTVAWNTAPYIGHRSAGPDNMRGYVAEIWLYDHILSSGDYTTFKSAVTTKYGLTLA